MLVLSFSSFIEEAIAKEDVDKLSGNVSSFDKLVRKESLELLEKKHEGLFAYLAFHPKADQPVADYVKNGTLASDSGPNILVLFTLDAEAKWAAPMSSDAFDSWLDLDNSVHPSYELIRIMFAQTVVPPLPGIVFFDCFTKEREPVYVSLQGLSDPAQVKEVMRTVFSLADYAYRSSRERGSFAEGFGVELQKKRIGYQKAGRKSMMEWLVKAYQVVWDHKGDIVSVVGLIK
jgi:hypothetical protein